jgi:PAS domain S-box-containing protein
MGLALDELIAAIPGQVWIALRDSKLAFVSEDWCAYTGLNRETASGHGWEAVIHPDDLDRVRDAWLGSLEGKRSGHVEGRVRRCDGVYRRFLIDIGPVFDGSSGQVVGCSGANVDIEDRRQAEENLRQRERELTRTHYHLTEGQRLSQTASFSSDPAIDEHTWSDEFYRICDFDVGSQASIQRLRDIVHPDDVHSFDTVVDRGLAGHNFDFLFRIITPKGALKFLRGVGRVVDRVAGRPIFVGAIQDVTATKLADAALRASERGLRAIVDAIPAGVTLLSPTGAVEVANGPALEYLGKSLEELIRSGTSDAIHPQDLAHSTAALNQSLATNVPYDVELRLRRYDGSYRWFHVQGQPIQDSRDKAERWYILYTDIDSRKHAEGALRESERNARLARDSIPGMVVVFTADGQVESVNRRTLDYFGQTPEQLAQWQSGEAVHPDDRAWVFSRFARAIQSGEPFEWENRSRRHDGVYRWHQTRGSPLRDESGRVVRWYNLIVDIDERKRAEEALAKLESDFAHMNRVSMMGELAASLAHEITQPITSARNNARAAENFLGMQPPQLTEASEALSCIVADADRAGHIIERIRAHIKKASPQKEFFDVNPAIEEVIALARSAIARSGVSIHTHFVDGMTPVRADRVQIQQVVLNLILNGIEAMHSVAPGTRDLLITTEQDHSGARVEVRDSGPGIDPANRHRVFQSFYTTKTGGIGMGLSICRSIIDAHGGRLSVDANAPCGAVFQFTLPPSA